MILACVMQLDLDEWLKLSPDLLRAKIPGQPGIRKRFLAASRRFVISKMSLLISGRCNFWETSKEHILQHRFGVAMKLVTFVVSFFNSPLDRVYPHRVFLLVTFRLTFSNNGTKSSTSSLLSCKPFLIPCNACL